MKHFFTAIALLLSLSPLAAQQNEIEPAQSAPSATLIQEPVETKPLKRHTALALSSAVVSYVNSQEQQGFPIQLDFRRQFEEISYWGITAQYTSRKDAWVVGGEHYSDDNDQQMIMVLGTFGLRVPLVREKLFFQFDLGCGVGYHIMKYDKVYPNKLIGYVHLSHWVGYRINDALSLKLSVLPNITLAPYDAGAAYSRHPNVYGIYSIGMEFHFKNK